MILVNMGKNKKRKHSLFHAAKSRGETAETSVASMEDCRSDESICDEDLLTAIKVLRTITDCPGLLEAKQCKELRVALHPLVLRQMQSYQTIDYGMKVTSALQNEKWADALLAIRGCRDFHQIPKHGTMQRWVRCCDNSGEYKLKLLSSLLRLSEGVSSEGSNNQHDPGMAFVDEAKVSNELIVLEGWSIPDDGDDDNNVGGISIDADVSDVESRIIYREEAAERKPSNHYDLLLHTTKPSIMRWNQSIRTISKHAVPFVSGAFCLSHVMDHSECDQLRSVATFLGFRADHPTSMTTPTGIDSCEWLVDSSIRSVIFDRVQQFLPSDMAGAKLHSINPRWRFFRYGPNCVYRPHIDGSWQESRINDKGQYECDETGQVKSYLTFLIYLSDDFEGGETRFYAPARGHDGIMEARGVIPRKGAVLIFPQGNTASLIHEGAEVTNGTKYVIRTDVLYSHR